VATKTIIRCIHNSQVELGDHVHASHGGFARTCEDIVSYLERRIQVCLAGVVGEALDEHQSNVDDQEDSQLFSGPSGRGDAKVARELLQLLRNVKWPSLQGTHRSQLRALLDDLWKRTVNLVQEETKIISGLTSNLAERLRVAGLNQVATLPAREIEALEGIQKWVGERCLKSMAEIDPAAFESSGT
jgi:hypothetical protein